MKINKKGFTLMEMLATLMIIGILMLFGLPRVRNIQVNNREKKYKAYEKAVLSSAKLYVDSYKKDMFGDDSSGCAEITIADLKNKMLLKTFNNGDGVVCNDGMVQIIKEKGKYDYQVFMVCKKDQKQVYPTDNKKVRIPCSER